MKKIFLLLGIGLMALNAALAQDKEVSVAAIYDGTFRTEGLDVLRSRNNGTQYTLLNYDWALYPDKNHGIYGGKTREQLYTKMTNFILNNL